MFPWLDNTGAPTWAGECSMWLIDATVKTTVVLIMAFLCVRMLRRWDARVRRALWSAALLGPLALPVVTHLVPTWRVGVWPGSLQTIPDAVGGARFEIANVASTVLATVASQIPWAEVTVGLWLAGAVALLIRLSLACMRVQRLVREAAPWRDTAGKDAAQRLAEQAGISRNVRILEHSRVCIPFTWGLLRPVILMPSHLGSCLTEHSRVVLQHELAHIKRNDWLIQVLAQVACAIHWFNPLMWIALRQLHLERERACDDSVLHLGVKRSEYASILLEMAQVIGSSSRQSATTLCLTRRDGLSQRIIFILRHNGPHRRGMLVAPVVVAVIASLVLSLAALELTPAAPDVETMSALGDAPEGFPVARWSPSVAKGAGPPGVSDQVKQGVKDRIQEHPGTNLPKYASKELARFIARSMARPPLPPIPPRPPGDSG